MASADCPQSPSLPSSRAYPSYSIPFPQSWERELRQWRFHSWRHPLLVCILEERLQFDVLPLLPQLFLLKPNRFSLTSKRTGNSWLSRSTRSWMKLFQFSTPTRSTRLCVTPSWLKGPSELLRLCVSPPASSSASTASPLSPPPVPSKWFFLLSNFTFLGWELLEFSCSVISWDANLVWFWIDQFEYSLAIIISWLYVLYLQFSVIVLSIVSNCEVT